MKVTITQIERALNNSFEFGTDGTQEQYNAIRNCENSAILEIGSQVRKTEHYFTKTDWIKVYTDIKNKLA